MFCVYCRLPCESLPGPCYDARHLSMIHSIQKRLSYRTCLQFTLDVEFRGANQTLKVKASSLHKPKKEKSY